MRVAWVVMVLGSCFACGCGRSSATPLKPEPSALEAFEAEQQRAREEAAAAFEAEPTE